MSKLPHYTSNQPGIYPFLAKITLLCPICNENLCFWAFESRRYAEDTLGQMKIIKMKLINAPTARYQAEKGVDTRLKCRRKSKNSSFPHERCKNNTQESKRPQKFTEKVLISHKRSRKTALLSRYKAICDKITF